MSKALPVAMGAVFFAGLIGFALLGGDRAQEAGRLHVHGQDAPQDKAPAARADDWTGLPMALIPAGSFFMGSDEDDLDAGPRHEVELDSFYIDTFEVTQRAYEVLMKSNPSKFVNADQPVERVTWEWAARFCNARSRKENLKPCYDEASWSCAYDAPGYRLPTEAEWEYVCRAGSKGDFFWGSDPAKLKDHAWYNANAGGQPHPVGTKKPHPSGVHDLLGNVAEWLNDGYAEDAYKKHAGRNPIGPAGGWRMFRGGHFEGSPGICRAWYRSYNDDPDQSIVCASYFIYGFRCVRRAVDTGTRTSSD